MLIASFERVFPTPANSKDRPRVKKVRFFFRARKNTESGNHGDFKVRRETPLLGLTEPSREVRRAAIGRGRINPTIKLRLPHAKARQIAWMSTVPGNHDQIVSPRISGEIPERSSLVRLGATFLLS